MTTTDDLPVWGPWNPISSEEDRNALIAGLRDLADFFEKNPDVPTIIMGAEVSIGYHCSDRDNFVRVAKLIGGGEKEVTDGGYFQLIRRFGPHVDYHIQTTRDEVCERVVVAREEVEVEEPDPDAVAALPKVKRTEIVEQVEWRCPDSLLRS